MNYMFICKHGTDIAKFETVKKDLFANRNIVSGASVSEPKLQPETLNFGESISYTRAWCRVGPKY